MEQCFALVHTNGAANERLQRVSHSWEAHGASLEMKT